MNNSTRNFTSNFTAGHRSQQAQFLKESVCFHYKMQFLKQKVWDLHIRMARNHLTDLPDYDMIPWRLRYAGFCRCDGMVDVTDSKSVPGNRVWVRVPPPAPDQEHRIDTELQFGVFLFPLSEVPWREDDGALADTVLFFKHKLELTNICRICWPEDSDERTDASLGTACGNRYAVWAVLFREKIYAIAVL